LKSIDHSMVLREEIVTKDVQHDLDSKGIAKTAREEKLRARALKQHEAEENARMAKLYREVVLKEQQGPELVQLKPAAPKIAPGVKVEEREEVGSFGD
jgi:hypothetical protein